MLLRSNSSCYDDVYPKKQIGIAEQLLEAKKRGKDDGLLTTKELATKLNTYERTVSTALKPLREKELVVSNKRGPYVKNSLSERGLIVFSIVIELLKHFSETYKSRVEIKEWYPSLSGWIVESEASLKGFVRVRRTDPLKYGESDYFSLDLTKRALREEEIRLEVSEKYNSSDEAFDAILNKRVDLITVSVTSVEKRVMDEKGGSLGDLVPICIFGHPANVCCLGSASQKSPTVFYPEGSSLRRRIALEIGGTEIGQVPSSFDQIKGYIEGDYEKIVTFSPFDILLPYSNRQDTRVIGRHRDPLLMVLHEQVLQYGNVNAWRLVKYIRRCHGYLKKRGWVYRCLRDHVINDMANNLRDFHSDIPILKQI